MADQHLPGSGSMSNKDRNTFAGHGEQKDKRARPKSIVWFIALVVMYGAASVLCVMASKTGAMLTLGDSRLPVSAFAGILSTLANIFLIFVVVYYGKTGFITSMILVLGQFPIMYINIVARKNLGSLPGLFNALFTIIAIIMIYRRNKRIESFQLNEVSYLKDQQKYTQRLFEQTATALVNAIDAKDTYSRGHSVRGSLTCKNV